MTESAQYARFAAFVRDTARRHYAKAQLAPYLADDDAATIAADLWMRRGELISRADYPAEKAFFAALRQAARWRVLNRVRHYRCDRRAALARAVTLDANPRGDYDEDGNERNIEPPYRSDGGAQAEKVRNMGTPEEWRVMTLREICRVRANGKPANLPVRRVMNALMRYRTDRSVRTKAKVSRRQLETILKILKVRFAQCYQAYRASHAERRRTTL